MPLRRMTCLISVMLLSMAGRADTFSFKLSGPSDSGQGTLVAIGTGVPGDYLVTGITGVLNGLTITSLIDPGIYPPDAPNDNLFYFPAAGGTTYFDECGVSFELADGTDVNLYYGTYSSIAGEIGPGYVLVEGVDETASAATSLSIAAAGGLGSAAAPEPSTLMLLSSGVALLSGLRGFKGWRRRV